MTYADQVKARRRLLILKLMIEDGGQANDGALLTAMRELGERVDLDKAGVRQLMRDLGDRDCVLTEMVRDVVMLGRITEHGRMAAAGDLRVDGVKSPFEGL